MRHASALIATAVAAGLVAPSTARPAEAVGVLAVAPPPGPSPELVELTAQLRQVMAERSAGVLEARELRDRIAGELPGASLSELDRAYEGARVAYVNGDYEGSVRTLRAIIGDLEKLPDGDESFKQWTRAMMRLAKAELDLGHVDAAHGVLERLVRSAPEVEADGALYPPKFQRQVDDARAHLRTLPTRRLSVTSSAKGVRVFVNGREVGSAPVDLLLARGRYRVSGVHGTVRAPALSVDLGDEDRALLLDLTIPEALRPNLGPGLALANGDRSRQIVAAGAFLGLDSVLAVGFGEEGGVSHLVGSLYDVRRGMLTREGRVRLSNKTAPVGGTSALAEFLATGREAPGLVEVPTSSPTASTALDLRPREVPAKPVELGPAPGISKASSASRTRGWVAFGSGIASLGLAGFGVLESLSASGKYNEARKLLVNGQTLSAIDRTVYRQNVSDGDAAKRNATIGFAAAGVGAISAGILGYLSYKQTGEIGPFRF